MTIEILTGILVLITAYYARQNRAMVVEMRKARGVQVAPKLMPTLRLLGAGSCLPRIVNVGPGPAMRVDVTLTLEPDGPSRQWVTAVIASGETHDFYQGEDLKRADDLVTKHPRLKLVGRCEDALGATLDINEVINIREIWELAKSSQHLQPSEDPIAKRLKEINKSLGTISKEFKGLVRRTAAAGNQDDGPLDEEPTD